MLHVEVSITETHRKEISEAFEIEATDRKDKCGCDRMHEIDGVENHCHPIY